MGNHQPLSRGQNRPFENLGSGRARTGLGVRRPNELTDTEKMKPNQAPSPNRRPRFPLGVLGQFDYFVCAPPASPAAVGDAHRWRVTGMLCENCGKTEATVHVTVAVAESLEQMTKHNLCEACWSNTDIAKKFRGKTAGWTSYNPPEKKFLSDDEPGR